jgi:hypothetical protein
MDFRSLSNHANSLAIEMQLTERTGKSFFCELNESLSRKAKKLMHKALVAFFIKFDQLRQGCQ